MLNDFLDRAQSRGPGWFYGVSLGGGVLLLIFTFWLWWHYFYLNPQNVFWSAVNNNLTISGVTKHTKSADESASIDQYEQISLGAQNVVRTVSTSTQEVPKSTVVKQTIGTPDANYIRYEKIDIEAKSKDGPKPDFSEISSKWGVSKTAETNSGAFVTALFFDLIPFGRLDAQQRQTVVGNMKNGEVYNIDFDKVAKERSGKGRLYYIYDASVSAGKYIDIIKQIDGYMGLNQLKQLDPSAEQTGVPLKVKIKIDAVSHQFSSVTYVDNNQTIDYSAWGAALKITIPEQTIQQAELQQQLNNILGAE